VNAPVASRNILPILAVMAIAGPKVTTVAAQAVPICSAVTVQDATGILGSTAKRTRDPSGCQWEDPTHHRVLNVAVVPVPSMFAAARSQSARDGKTQDEPGLGGAAFSTIPTSDRGNRVALYSLKGSTLLILDLEEDGAAGRLPQMRDVMRKLVAIL
jgi:hypothetical protein